jgi:hypothetical protein
MRWARRGRKNTMRLTRSVPYHDRRRKKSDLIRDYGCDYYKNNTPRGHSPLFTGTSGNEVLDDDREI